MPVAVIVSSGYNDATSLLVVTYCVDILGSFAYPQSIRHINPQG
jgi:hypothetical protein